MYRHPVYWMENWSVFTIKEVSENAEMFTSYVNETRNWKIVGVRPNGNQEGS